MPPLPKDPKLRRRRNKESTAATLVDTRPIEGVPELPKRRRRWNPLTRAWWRDVWASPMAGEYVQADVHGLYVLADLVDRYWREPSVVLAAEIRLQRQCFGLTPIDRRRLQWEVKRLEEAGRAAEARRPRRQRVQGDPRDYLEVLEGGRR